MFSVIASAGHAGRVAITKWNPRHSDHCYCVNRLPKIKRSAIKTFLQEDFVTMPDITSKQATSLMKVKHQYDVHPRTAQRAVRDLRMASEEDAVAQAQRIKVTPTPINCSQCRWTHDSQRTPCRHPPKKDTPAQEGLN